VRASSTLEGKVALVTGAGQGIGRAIARALGERGASLGLTDLNADTLAATVSEVEPLADTVAVAGDVTDPRTSADLVASTVDRFGGVDVLVNNVGIVIPGSLLDTTVEQFDEVMHVNVLSYLLMMQRAVPEIRRRGGGSIVNIASVGGLVALPNVGAYCASKSAVIGLTRAAASELAPDIRCNTVCPGGVDTPMAQKHMESFEDTVSATALLTGRQLIKRYAEPREIANVVAFLASDESSFMTGAVVAVEAGHTAC